MVTLRTYVSECATEWGPHAQERRHQMMNDVQALCDVNHPSLVRFIGAFHTPENGQVLVALKSRERAGSQM